MAVESLIMTYGYAAILVGTFFEGETVLILAGFAAHRGYLSLAWVILYGFLGTLSGDQLYFYLGRREGTKILDRHPRWHSKSERVFGLLHSHPYLIILGFRFFYGFRTITPLLVGASRVSPMLFLILNTTGACLWAISIGGAGYFFGHVAETIIGNIRKYELSLFIGLAAAGLIVWSVHWLRRERTSGGTGITDDHAFIGSPVAPPEHSGEPGDDTGCHKPSCRRDAPDARPKEDE